MKTKIIAIIMGAALAQYSSVALGVPGVICPQSICKDTYVPTDLTSGCTQKTYTCYTADGTTVKLASCDSCTNSKASRTKKETNIIGCKGTYYFYTCECPLCTSCTSDKSWSSAGTGYEKKVTASCDCGECTKTTAYRCAAGYYGTSTNGSTGCTICPTSGGVGGQSVAGSNSAITSCYIPANTTLSDSTGTYQYTSNCYYK